MLRMCVWNPIMNDAIETVKQHPNSVEKAIVLGGLKELRFHLWHNSLESGLSPKDLWIDLDGIRITPGFGVEIKGFFEIKSDTAPGLSDLQKTVYSRIGRYFGTPFYLVTFRHDFTWFKVEEIYSGLFKNPNINLPAIFTAEEYVNFENNIRYNKSRLLL